MTEDTDQPSRVAMNPEAMHALRLLLDRQGDIQHLSNKTYETVLPLTALLDLLRRPQDQQELGRQLAEALRQILVSVQATARDMASLVAAHRDQQQEMRDVALRLQDIEARQKALMDGQALLNRAITALHDDLFEEEAAS